MVFLQYSRKRMGGLKLKMRMLYFYYDLILMGNQVPFIFNSIFFGVISLFLYRYVHLIASIPFLLMALYNFVLAPYDYFTSVLLKRKEDIPENVYENMSVLEVMLKRISVRCYQRRYLTKEDEEFVLDQLNSVKKLEGIQFHYIKYDFQTILVTDAYQYVVCVIPKKYTDDHLMSVGSSLQEVILRMTKKGISTCWAGGFRGDQVEKTIKDFDSSKDHIAVCMAFGYESQYKPRIVQQQQKRSRTRFDRNKLFFDTHWGNKLLPDKEIEWMSILEATQWAPSASNMQQTRIIKDNEGYHFYKQGGSVYYSMIGIGISMRNWQNACEWFEFKGKFEKIDQDIKVPKDAHYMISWTPTE